MWVGGWSASRRFFEGFDGWILFFSFSFGFSGGGWDGVILRRLSDFYGLGTSRFFSFTFVISTEYWFGFEEDAKRFL